MVDCPGEAGAAEEEGEPDDGRAQQLDENGVQTIEAGPSATEELQAALELYRALAHEDVADLLERSKWLERGQGS